jgi:GNAT superfamily N-acetyltransferase
MSFPATIRPATVADIDTLFVIRTSVRQNHLSREQMADLGITPQALAEAIEASPCAWVAEFDGKAGGFAMVDGESGEVFALFVRPEFEGCGLGALLLAAAEECLFREHASIWLVTDGGEDIRANAFYLGRGWQLAGRVDERDVRYEKVRPAT